MGTIKITERGWIGHSIVGHLCQFRRNTLVEVDDKRAVVSTIGQYTPFVYGTRRTVEQIGPCRWYETIAFIAKFDGRYWDINVEEENIYYDVIEAKSFMETYAWAAKRYPQGIDNAANDMHEKAVLEVAEILKKMKEEGGANA